MFARIIFYFLKNFIVEYMIKWLINNRNDILKKYPEADSELSLWKYI